MSHLVFQVPNTLTSPGSVRRNANHVTTAGPGGSLLDCSPP